MKDGNSPFLKGWAIRFSLLPYVYKGFFEDYRTNEYESIAELKTIAEEGFFGGGFLRKIFIPIFPLKN